VFFLQTLNSCRVFTFHVPSLLSPPSSPPIISLPFPPFSPLILPLFFFLIHTLNICKVFPNAILIQSGWLSLHSILLISIFASYANIGSSTGFGPPILLKSQISAWLSSAHVHIWEEECGAHAVAFTGPSCPANVATGREGTRTSRIMVLLEFAIIVAR
jgi:hypothetical protein